MKMRTAADRKTEDIKYWSDRSYQAVRELQAKARREQEKLRKLAMATCWRTIPEPATLVPGGNYADAGSNQPERTIQNITGFAGSRFSVHDPGRYAGQVKLGVEMALEWNAWADARGLPVYQSHSYSDYVFACVRNGLTRAPAEWYARLSVAPPPGLEG